jgi:hypothetical protein
MCTAPRSAAPPAGLFATSVGQHSALLVGPVLADHYEGRQEYGFERHDHGEQSERVGLDPEADPGGKPDDVDIDEPHRAGESRARQQTEAEALFRLAWAADHVVLAGTMSWTTPGRWEGPGRAAQG